MSVQTYIVITATLLFIRLWIMWPSLKTPEKKFSYLFIHVLSTVIAVWLYW
jgi:hypothetical protein